MAVDMFEKMFISEEALNGKKPEVVLSQLDAIVKMARECINMQQFQQYKAKFEQEEKEMLTVMIAYTNSFILSEQANPMLYAMRMAMFIQKLYDLRRLLRTTENDATRKIGEAK